MPATPMTARAEDMLMRDRARIELTEADQLAHGTGRVIYRHPHNPAAIIKVHGALRVKRFQRLRTLFRPVRRRFGPIMNSWVEIEEMASIVARNGGVPKFLSQFLGFVETSKGVGAVFEAVLAEDGALATPLFEHANVHGAEPEMERAIDALWDQIVAVRAVVIDPNLSNVVVTGTARVGYTLTLVDGLGERTVIPIQSLSDRAYARAAGRARAEMKAAYRVAATSL